MGRMKRWSLVVLLVVVWSSLPITPRATAALAPPDPVPPVPATRDLPPVVDPRLPSLVLDLAVTPDAIAVGDTATLRLTVTNQAPDPAHAVELRLPVPDGSIPVASPDFVSADREWRWTFTQLSGGASAVVTAQVSVTQRPTGGALLARPRVTARGLDQPVQAVEGALVYDRARPAQAARFVPGEATVLRSADGQLAVRLPAQAAPRALTVRHAQQPAPGEPLPPALVNGRRGFGAFFLTATDDAEQDVHQFEQPLSLEVQYTEAQLQALGIAAPDLTVFWFDPQAGPQRQGLWVPVPSTLDPTTRTVRATVDHFSAFQLGDGSRPSEAYLPSLKDWQVSLFTGGAAYSMPIDVPASAAGLKPNLTLSYASGATDGDSGLRPKQQSSWVGKGWSLDTGSVARQQIMINPDTGLWVDTFSLVFNGQSATLVRAEQLVPSPDQNNITHWAWRPTNESFLKVRVVENGDSVVPTVPVGTVAPDHASAQYGRGGYVDGVLQKRLTWQVWAKDGMRYEFSEDAWSGWDQCASANTMTLSPYQWHLSKVIDTHGNTISYSYGRSSYVAGETSCDWWNSAKGTVDRDVWPRSITWGANLNTGAPDRYSVVFVSSARAGDTAFEGADNQYASTNGQPRQTRRLDAIQVKTWTGSTWELLRQYNLGYDYSLLSDQTLDGQANTTYPKLTLRSVTRVANNGTTALPTTSFSYGTSRGSGTWANANWNRLTSVNNGQGGTLSFTYEQIGQAVNKTIFNNHRRITSKTVSDGRGNSYIWSYSYQNPALNSLGSNITGANDPNATQAHPNSAALYYNEKWDPYHPNQAWLATRAQKEFRGHSLVIETDPNGGQTEHWFYQGDVGCTPTATYNNIVTDSCFVQLRDREALRGREYRTTVRGASSSGSPLLHETQSSFVVDPTLVDYTATPLTGLWRMWSYQSQTVETAQDGTAASTKTTKYFYDPAAQEGGQRYGNLSKVEEWLGSSTPERITLYRYETRDSVDTQYSTPDSYIVDRRQYETIFNGGWQHLAMTFFLYDGNTTTTGVGTRGNLTLVRRYFDVPLQSGSLTNQYLHSTDTSYAYDTYGNRTAVRTYPLAGVRRWTGAANEFSPPGNGSAPWSTLTVYDNPATSAIEANSGLPYQVTNAAGHVERAGYDYRMATLTSMTDANGNLTTASYDTFGRLSAIIRPGDTVQQPTTQMIYDDYASPFRYELRQREGQAQFWDLRVTQQFYDGLGRQIQLKAEGDYQAGLPYSTIQDWRYDGLGNVTHSSQPRYAQESMATPTSPFYLYTAPGSASVMRWTTTTYDALNRPRLVTYPDATRDEHRYSVLNGLQIHDLIDANRHRIQRRSDALGRLVQVDEISGDCGNYWGYTCAAPYTTIWQVASSTTYTYSPLDLLTMVEDAKDNQTTIAYDSAGRKTAMTDLDMGTWNYTYDANNNLTRQTDAKGQTIDFTYDALNRLTAKIGSDDRDSYYAYDQAIQGSTQGIGHRTSTQVYVNNIQQNYQEWRYDARGRKISQAMTGSGLPGPWQFSWSYDSADRVTEIIYPSGEAVQYTYDVAWRPASLTGNGTNYISNARYTALDQPTQRTVSNGTTQTWTYGNVMGRVSAIQVGSGALFARTYTYDNVGNVATIHNQTTGQQESFTYDHRDRLTRAWTIGGTNGYDTSMSYDVLGNLISKGGVSYSYGATGTATVAGPHQARSIGGATYTYDANGNLTSGPGRAFSWNSDNLPVSVTQNSVTETYTYDADGERTTRSVNGVTTVFMGGLYEEDLQTGTKRMLYQFNGQIVAQRSDMGKSQIFRYLYSDHLGSVSAATDEAGTSGSTQDYTPWGAIRAGGIPQTSRNYTGQSRDSTGLLYYHARLYDPDLARFVSADSVVPGSPSGSMDGVALKPLTVDLHEPGFVRDLGVENRRPFWFQMDDEQRQQAGKPWGPENPQALNRYSYVQNNPLKYTDPTGHVSQECTIWGCTTIFTVEETRNLGIALNMGALTFEAFSAFLKVGGITLPAALVLDMFIKLYKWGGAALVALALSGGHAEVFCLHATPAVGPRCVPYPSWSPVSQKSAHQATTVGEARFTDRARIVLLPSLAADQWRVSPPRSNAVAYLSRSLHVEAGLSN